MEARSGKNDAFLDDDLEELLEIGGDPSFLEAVRESKKPDATSGFQDDSSKPFEWDGTIDETAYFDDE